MKSARLILAVMALILVCLTGCSEKTVQTPSAPPQTATPSLAPAMTDGSIEYRNEEYGFTFTLPADWKGYTIVMDKWKGDTLDGSKTQYEGPELFIRSPKWTGKEPTQDIPIMIFTIDQYNDLSKDKFHIGAAPIGPMELGRNSKYVFALPARYNYAFLKDFEQVEKILNGKPLKPIK